MANKWGNNGTMRDFILGGSKITALADCSTEIKRRLLLGRKAMTNLDNILKSRDITGGKKMVHKNSFYNLLNFSINLKCF